MPTASMVNCFMFMTQSFTVIDALLTGFFKKLVFVCCYLCCRQPCLIGYCLHLWPANSTAWLACSHVVCCHVWVDYVWLDCAYGCVAVFG